MQPPIANAPTPDAAVAQVGNPAAPPSAKSDASPSAAPPAIRIGWTTFPTQDEADLFARAAVVVGHVSCAQVSGPITSHYRWRGELHRATEWRVTLKFPAARAAALEAWLHASHPYETPQWLAVDAAQIASAYHAWLHASCPE